MGDVGVAALNRASGLRASAVSSQPSAFGSIKAWMVNFSQPKPRFL
jgi:hypothetical protein